MDTPPEGYRTNVGICLADPSLTKAFPVARGRCLRNKTDPEDVTDKLNARWEGKCQPQKWFLFRLTGSDDDINLMGNGSEKPEFSESTWITPNQVIEKMDHFFPAG